MAQSFPLPNGARLALASAYGVVKAMSAVSNAATAVATLEASHGVAAGEFIEVTSGWTKLDGKIIKAGTIATNDVPLLGIDSQDTSLYPAAGGAGSVREISTWVEVPKVLDFQFEGGDPEFTTVQPLDADSKTDLLTSFTAMRIRMEVSDTTVLSWYAVAAAAHNKRAQIAARLTLPSGDIILYNGTLAHRKTPRMSVNQVMTQGLILAIQGDGVTRYSAP